MVPLTTRPSAPSATSCFASFCAASKSTEPSAFMGVTIAGRIRPKGAGSRRCIVPSVIVPTVLPATDAEAPEFATISQYELPSRDQNPPPLEQSSRCRASQSPETSSHWNNRYAKQPLTFPKLPLAGTILPSTSLPETQNLQLMEQSSRCQASHSPKSPSKWKNRYA